MRAWLFSIMHNVHIDNMRKNRNVAEQLGDDMPEPIAITNLSSGLHLMELESALKLLPNDQREVLLLVALEEMSYDEVSRALEIPIGTVMSRLSRGREKLRLLMEGQPVVSTLKVVK